MSTPTISPPIASPPLEVDETELRAESARIADHLARFGECPPAEQHDELRSLERRLGGS